MLVVASVYCLACLVWSCDSEQFLLLQELGPNERTGLLRNDPINAERTIVSVHRWDLFFVQLKSTFMYLLLPQGIIQD